MGKISKMNMLKGYIYIFQKKAGNSDFFRTFGSILLKKYIGNLFCLKLKINSFLYLFLLRHMS